ncbi:MAG: T9SS type A sorting domain-containing protein [Dysgonamonadaceae bacterium]|jgi:hypothetical protein|nr:T9SS type A sorting domain-containing protein [Dysgonamonadaceae bacterium]
MKKITGYLLLLFMIISRTQTIAGQTNDNTIVNGNNLWVIQRQNVCPECPGWTWYVYFDGDSIVTGYSYKKVFSCEDKLYENIKYEGLIREQDKKTYFIPANSETEYLLYDFSLEEGMTFEHPIGLSQETRLLEVKKSDRIEINGVKKKRLQITDYSYDYVIDTWIEDVGSLGGILYPCLGLGLDGSIHTLLLDYYQNNELKYSHENITSVQPIEMKDCGIFPNPVGDILNISCLNNAILRIEIFDNLGKKVYSQTDKDIINVSSFSKGIYLLKVYDMDEQVSVFKFIKK